MAVGMRALLDTVMQALPQVGNLGLLFMLLFFIFAALGVELFGDLICDELHPCEGLGRYATFKNFGMAFLLLFRVSTGDNWNGIMKDTLRDCQQENAGTCYNTVVSPIYFVSFVLTAQFVLVNVVIAVLMKHLEESNKEAKEEAELEAELELELQHGGRGGGGSGRSPQLSPLALGMEEGSGGSPWRSPEREIQRRGNVMDSPPADITRRDSIHISTDPPLSLEPPLEVELLDPEEPLEDNLLSVRKSAVGRTHSLPNDSYMFLPLEPFGPPGASLAPGLAPVLTQATGPQHIEALNRALSGSSASVRSQPEESSQQLAVPTDFFRPISPHSLSDSENIPRLPPPRHTHTLSRTLRRQVAVSNDSQEALWSDGVEGEEGVLNVASLALPLSSSSSSSHLHQQPSLRLVPATPGASPQRSRPSSVHTQHPFSNHDQHHLSSSPNSPSSLSSPPPPLPSAHPWRQEEASADHEVSLINRAGLVSSEDVTGVGLRSEVGGLEGSYQGYEVGRGEGSRPCLRQLKRFHSADAQGRSILASRPRPLSWLDDPRRHSVEVCSSVESSPQRSTTSTSSGFVSRADSLQIHSQTTTKTLPSPRRKKKMSPPCISVDPPDGLESQPGLHPTLGGLGGLGMPPPLPSRDTSCLRRRAPSSDSKDSFDLGAGEGLGQEGGGPNPKLLTLPSFSFEKTSSEH